MTTIATDFEIIDAYYCPITGELMQDPVMDHEGHSYEKNANKDGRLGFFIERMKTRISKIKVTKKKQIESLYKVFISKNESTKIMINPSNTNIKCLKKKKQLFVSNLSDAINEVDTREKNKPVRKNKIMKLKITLSKFFHHL